MGCVVVVVDNFLLLQKAVQKVAQKVMYKKCESYNFCG